ncbi:polysaccharide deacetylase family protein [Sulfurimonas sp.]|jgi:peptidoglycan/xylan/chitin deacetylase (PgdA/CDA1 family)|uniref:polysaccharide deacetylase family protein n=1 Tax=Sulfurimonas sp. TaxID=2022749 RepID=UPI0025E9AB93|nr:polysaccharide deacetylase family protein [Sulfurimonas sp.]MCK9472345.1 polysaccharide deacetylase family protein [Sulfurimonas sp.]MDD3506120.1 polysaccharide deacetylase family protein [Sulfurimonas sp.]
MKKMLSGFLFLLFCAGFLSAQNQGDSQSEGVVVFMYHRFEEPKYPSTNIRMEQFEKHLEYLSQNGYSVWALSKIVRYIVEGREIPKKVVSLTIDDAYKSIYTHAFAKFKEYNFPFTVFVNSSPIDNDSKNYMSWDEMREMKLFGAEFANHSKTHDYMLPKEGELSWKKRIKYELESTQQRLHEELGEETNENPKLFSYPFGEYTKETASFIKDLGYVGVTQTSGVIDIGGDTKFLPRFPMAEAYADMNGFVLKLKALPLPIKEITPKEEPLISSENPPTLTLELKYPLKNLNCYLSSGEPLSLEWASETKVLIRAKKRLEPPREKYTCTAQAKEGRWYWYSHLWIIK